MKDKRIVILLILTYFIGVSLGVYWTKRDNRHTAIIKDLKHWQVSHQEVHAASHQEVHAESESYKTQDLITYGDCHLCHDPIIRTINYERGE